MSGMTDEQKELEAMKLVNHIDEMARLVCAGSERSECVVGGRSWERGCVWMVGVRPG